jgi:hypothetical protein
MTRIFLLCILSFFLGQQGFATVNYNKEFTGYIGMSMISFAENQKTIAGENVSEPVAGTVSAITASLQYTFQTDSKKHLYFTTSFPLLSGSQLYINASFGMEYYFNDVATKTQLYSSGTSLSITPTLRYFVGGEIGAGYLVYTSEDATKSDVLFEIGGNGGISYAFNPQWAAKAKVSILRGTGVVTSTMNITAIMGVTRFID